MIKLLGMVNCAPGSNQTPAVIDGCSDLLVEIFGDAQGGTPRAVGMTELPLPIAVELNLRLACTRSWSTQLLGDRADADES